MASVMIVDDEKNYLWMLDELLRGEGYEVITCETGPEALSALRDAPVDVLLTDLRMAEMDGMTLIEKSREISPTTTTVLMTAYGTIERAVEAMRCGAYDFLVKPFENADLLRSIRRAVERSVLVRENVRLSQSLARHHQLTRLIGKSPLMKDVCDKINRVANSKSAVLITGESGSGKELVARAIHFNGPGSGRPFLAVNCGALVDSLAESELFGHEKGSFTGAHARHLGVFEQAQGGTIFLDEIGELPLNLQSKLLRVLDTGEIRRVGSEKSVQLDLRLVSATNRDLKGEVQSGRFREDLYFRISVVRIEVPPLRERKEDVPLLAEAYLQELIRAGGIHAKRFSPRSLQFLAEYRYPGNVRELHNLIAHAALMAQGENIEPEDFPVITSASKDWVRALDRIVPIDASLDEVLRTVETHMIDRALAQSMGVQARASEMLKISRSLLQYKLKQRQGRP
jgi:two-component system NtrC family response regulator